MSHFTTVQTKFHDKDLLIECLEELKPAWKGLIEDNGVPRNLYGYMGDKRDQQAHIIVRRQHVGGSSNDLGFIRKENGSYEAIISEFDRTRYSTDWMQDLGQLYAEKKTTKELKKNGWRINTRTVETDGRITLTVKRWR